MNWQQRVFACFVTCQKWQTLIAKTILVLGQISQKQYFSGCGKIKQFKRCFWLVSHQSNMETEDLQCTYRRSLQKKTNKRKRSLQSIIFFYGQMTKAFLGWVTMMVVACSSSWRLSPVCQKNKKGTLIKI